MLFVVLGEDGFQRFTRGLLSSGVPVEGKVSFVSAFFQLADVSVTNSSAKGSDGISDSVLPQFDDVHIAFGDEQGAFTCLHGLV